ncbi:GntP family gluconate:proton (H+) symporter [Actinobaculum suis]|uniref:GntP family gluconate:proton (H+) symporter n=1 Tax=Actinobaculum suis TaxID=1657 RepID=A0A0K9ERA0_9ACTO|nr:gluconate:H+ symporter [Actinobaculum suis]KMY22703.1 gluconate permease [Actinobaculum suis]VDG75464.1 GntP family gluconate:proton (H+) symporter [Actinobaculum suis]
MPLLYLALGIALLLLLMLKFKVNGFISLIIVSVVVGMLQGMPLLDDPDNNVTGLLNVIKTGVGGQTGKLVLLLGFGAMLGVFMADMGAANRLATTMINKFGIKHAQIAIIIVAFLVGVVLFWETAWVILIPIVFAVCRSYKIPIMWLAMPLAIALSTMHSFLPPHPGPSAVAGIYNASIGATLMWGLVIAIPIGAATALIWPRLPFVKKVIAKPPAGLVSEKEWTEDEMPPFGISLLITALPVLLIGGHAIMEVTLGHDNPVTKVFTFIGHDWFALMISLIFAILYFTLVRKVPMDSIMKSCTGSVKSIAMIVFIIGGGGAFAAVLKGGGISDYILQITQDLPLSPILLAWAIAAVMRVALGSASVAVVTAAGIAAPLVAAGSVSPEVMVLATACGSVMASHVNDPGFWMFKEFLGLSVADTLRVRTGYTTVLSFLGLAGCLLLGLVVPA